MARKSPSEERRARDALRETQRAELAETDADPALASLLDLPVASALVLHGAPGTVAEDLDGFHDELSRLLALHDVERTGPRAARVRGENGVTVDLTWEAHADPRATAREAQRMLYALPAVDDEPQPVRTGDVDTGEEALRHRYHANIAMRDEIAWRSALRREQARIDAQAQHDRQHSQETSTDLASRAGEADAEVRVINGPGIRGAYGRWGNLHR
jgi:hypothetical protein